MPKRIVVGITGATGSAYARTLLQALGRAGAEVHLVVSPLGHAVAATELGDSDRLIPEVPPPASITTYRHDDLYSPLASGSIPGEAMIVCPCTCHTLGSIAVGLGDNLLTRAAHVYLKESRPLVLCLREMPLGLVDLRNMLSAAEAGATICPLCPPFYGQPRSVDDLVRAVVGRVLDLVDIPNDLAVRWDGAEDT